MAEPSPTRSCGLRKTAWKGVEVRRIGQIYDMSNLAMTNRWILLRPPNSSRSRLFSWPNREVDLLLAGTSSCKCSQDVFRRGIFCSTRRRINIVSSHCTLRSPSHHLSHLPKYPTFSPYKHSTLPPSTQSPIMAATTHSDFGSATEAIHVAQAFASGIRGKTVLVTGVNKGGLGYATAQAIVSPNAIQLQ